jgi:hypothetical protein
MTGVLYPSTPKNLTFYLFLNKVIHVDRNEIGNKKDGKQLS